MKGFFIFFGVVMWYLYLDPWRKLLDNLLVLIGLKWYPATGDAKWPWERNTRKRINFEKLRHKIE